MSVEVQTDRNVADARPSAPRRPIWLCADDYGISASVNKAIRDLVMRGRRWALIGEPGTATGIVTISDVKKVPSDAWDRTPVARVATPISRAVTATPDASVRELLRGMGDREVNQIPIVEGARIVGAVTREAVLHAIQVRATDAAR